ncbi:YhfC family glutamic-type intramembrane protease [Ruminococcus sp.]|uniref:YhfC family intramembrane metalloprotease n=1 Tax=Ruminococcus sp. TaxID=41978 RepID=UPI002587C916|nr:YhfC family glutamic-type intramembrane protease [Ruminococcus sp.]MCR5021234.1 YhfC family intramembrane metalloprotease [Ruminococcus sp.]
MYTVLVLADHSDICYPKDSILFTILSGVLMVLIPVVIFLVMRKFVKFKIKPVIVGAAVWLLFAVVLKAIVLTPVIGADNSVSRAVNGNIWLFYMIAAASAGIFEETGRLVAFKTVLKKNDDKQDVLSYGIGHGGFEAVYLGFQIAFLGIMCLMINKGGIESVVKGADDTMIESLLTQIDKYTSSDIGRALLMGYERIPAMIVHIMFSVMVFAAVRERKIVLYFLSVFIHFVIDFSFVLYYAKIISLGVTEIMFTVEMLVFAVPVYKLLYKKMDSNTTERGMSDGISGNF